MSKIRVILGGGLFLLQAAGCRSADTVVVGSKNFTEQVILGELLAQHIENHTSLQVDRRLNLAGTFICDRAIRAGEIDGYIEYTGTAFTAILRNEPVSDREEIYRRVKESYGRDGLEWLQPLGFNNTFAIIIRARDAQRLGIRSISEVSRYTSQWIAGFGYEFIERADGFRGFAEAYAVEFAAAPRVMELGLIYRALADGEVDVIAGDSTSGLISALDLFVLEDDKGYFPPYDAVPLFRKETLDRYPDLRSVIDQLGGTISEEQMRKMNFEVDGKQRRVKEVVADFLGGLGGR